MGDRQEMDRRPSTAAVLDGIEVTLGGERVRITAPTIDESEAWREKLGEIAGEVAGVMFETADAGDAGGRKIIVAVVGMAARRGVQWLRDVVLAYAPEHEHLRPKIRAFEALAAFKAIMLELERDFFVESWSLYVEATSLMQTTKANGRARG